MQKAKSWTSTIAVIGIFIGFATGTYAIIFNLVPITSSISNQVGSEGAGVVINIIIISIVMIFAIEIILYYFHRPHVKAYFGKINYKVSISYQLVIASSYVVGV